MRFSAVVKCAMLLLLAPVPAKAAALRISPVSVELIAPARTAVLRLYNAGQETVHYQIRIFRWSQKKGRDQLEPTRYVVVSPPITRLKPGVDQVVRIVRVAKAPPAGEECYRVLVDELPKPGRRKPGEVALLVRHSIPVFFSGGKAKARHSDVSWQLVKKGDSLLLTAKSRGHRHLKVIDLTLKDGHGRKAQLAKGLAGYVLAGATRQWNFDASHLRKIRGGRGKIQYLSENGDLVDVPIRLPDIP